MSEAASPAPDRLRWLAEILTPTGILVGLLYYFGYVTTDAWFRYFGLDLAHVRLPQQAIVLQSIAALYVPLGALLVLALAVYGVRRMVNTLLERGWRPAVMRRVGPAAILLGGMLILRAVAGILFPDIARREWVATSPLSLCAGVLLVAGGVNLARRTSAASGSATRPASRSGWVSVGVASLVVLGLFWATNSVAAAYGRGRAMTFAQTLPDRPAVVVDTKERLFLVTDQVQESALSTDPTHEYRYRYRQLRLLAASEGRIYLVPATWRRGSGTVVVLPDDGVRLQFLR